MKFRCFFYWVPRGNKFTNCINWYKIGPMRRLFYLIRKNEDLLMEKVLGYAHRQDYVKYTSTLQEAWRMSIRGLSDALCDAIDSGRSMEFTSDDTFVDDPVAAFGIREASLHRQRGIPYPMFMGLFKYYRESYYDLVREQDYTGEHKRKYILFMARVFDRIEIAFSTRWVAMSGEEKLDELKKANREITNEKTMFLTVVESLASPVFFLSNRKEIVYMNRAASGLLNLSKRPGSFYYGRDRERPMLPEWLEKYTVSFFEKKLKEMAFEERNPPGTVGFACIGRIALMEDVSDKYSGVVIILNDITARINAEEKIKAQRDNLEKALADIKQLRGILPICSNCRKIRNDSGYWDQLEEYIEQHSDAEFSHGLCPECVDKLYPDYKEKKGRSD